MTETRFRIEAIAPIPPLIAELQAEAAVEGYGFVDTLVDDWLTGANRFNEQGETFLGCFVEDVLVAIGGVTIDPFLADPRIGRIRRVYVRSAFRNRGIGRALVLALVDHARRSFDRVRLRAENAGAARLYEHLGFAPIDDPDATHVLRF